MKFRLWPRRPYRYLHSMATELGPLMWHDHTNGHTQCPVCRANQVHYETCDCGHCPSKDPDAITARIIERETVDRDAIDALRRILWPDTTPTEPMGGTGR